MVADADAGAQRRARRAQAQVAAAGRREARVGDAPAVRPERQYQPAVDFKESMVAPLRAAGLDLRIAFEDDRRNVAMFREAGVPCVYIHSGYYE